MTERGGEREPTLHDVLAAIQQVAATQAEHGEILAGHGTALEGLSGELAGLKLDSSAYTELAEARHTEVRQDLEAIAGLVHEQQHALGQTEARLRSRIGDVQGVVQALKEDLAAHVDDTQVHRDTHGTAA